jgi:aspartyl-tRNA(Asn)/glutamyl-tRNA(Gln) amidotransferase subunit A
VSELTALTLAQARDGLTKKNFSAVELAKAHLAAIEKARVLNAYVLETAERAADMAKAADSRIAKGDTKPLDGIPIGVKDMFCTANVRTTACSHILDNFVPTYESTVTANLWRDGAVLLGKTNNDEFAMGSSNETSFFGPVISPWRRKGSNTPLVTGGSSGGSAAAVAANRHGRREANLWPLFALGDRRLRILARPGRAVCAQRARRRYPAALDGGAGR